MRTSLYIRCMPRTTLDIDASVLRELKRRQRQEDKSLGQLVSELLAVALTDSEPAATPTFTWVSRDLKPRVDLEDREAVAAVLDGR